MATSVTPAWLGEAILAVLDRLDDQLFGLMRVDQPESTERLDRIAALYERQARCWKVLAAHVGERVVWIAMFEARACAESYAEKYRGFAESHREFEARKAKRASGVA
ncbi:hypothetical protein [Saccharopolyspora sp. ASAGF58]|uniref:hypothetical protein n=1 Tax=Saccharopolyspora sp. ASAGF58 TaxID=2719023 RepID=UPI0014400A34|nr:hypothetical protein [Saccharopolyspora sp. ASAGF58]QIZ33938.1 hypothetical protein FDZ84_03330 [Saccharopolyspora sp. ASAGF58]